MDKELLSIEKIEKIKEICSEFNHKKCEIINILHKVQSTFGYLPAEVQKVVAKEMEVPISHIYGIVTFYSFFSMVPKGQFPISICLGTACYVRGAEKVLNEFKRILGVEVGVTTQDGLFSIDALRCVGACGLAPVVLVGEEVYGRVTPDEVKKILEKYKD